MSSDLIKTKIFEDEGEVSTLHHDYDSDDENKLINITVCEHLNIYVFEQLVS